jgi:iron complex transport system permease protein
VAFFGLYALSAAAFLGSLVTVVVVQRVARREGHLGMDRLLLSGIAVNTLAFAAIGLLIYLADDDQLRSFMFWTLGSLGRATWLTVAAVAPLLLGTLLATLGFARPLNLLMLGEAEAGHLGVSVPWLKRILVILAAVGVGAAVAVSGVVGFVGVLVPHVIRLLTGPDHRRVLPASALLGSTLVLLADLAARTLVAPAELPLGILTASLGAPFFVWLLSRRNAA